MSIEKNWDGVFSQKRGAGIFAHNPLFFLLYQEEKGEFDVKVVWTNNNVYPSDEQVFYTFRITTSLICLISA